MTDYTKKVDGLLCVCVYARLLRLHLPTYTTVGAHAYHPVKFGTEPDLQGQPVKFSLEPELLEEECQQLLLQYMPEHVRNTKITQRLFIK